MKKPVFRLIGALILGAASVHVGAAVIPSGEISGHSRAGQEHYYGATGSDVRDYTYSHHEAAVTTEGIKLSLTSTGSGFFNVTGAVADTYTVTGGVPGESLSLNAFLNISGGSENLFTPIVPAYFGRSDIDYGVGLLINSHPQNAGISAAANPVIDTGNGLVAGQFGVVYGASGEFSIANTASQKHVDFDVAIPVPLQITVGDAFILAVSVGIDHTALAHTDMLGTATLSFDLPDGYQINSELGFYEAAQVPLPPALAMMIPGLVGLLAICRRKTVMG